MATLLYAGGGASLAVKRQHDRTFAKEKQSTFWMKTACYCLYRNSLAKKKENIANKLAHREGRTRSLQIARIT